MSGSSSGSSGGYEPELDCGSISFNTDINSPQEKAIEGLEVQQKLNVELSGASVVLTRPDTGETVGSVNWSSIAKLIECLSEGNEYVAVVRDIQGGLIKVHISSK